MIDQVAAAFDCQDYRTAAQLLKQLLKQSPKNPWVQLYLARLQEVSGKLDASEAIYRQLLRDTTNPKLVSQARQGIQRLEQIQKERRQQAIAQATADPTLNEPGFLVLESVAGEDRAAAIQNFARIMKLDAYTVRMLLPTRGWRLYRSSTVGELQLYGQELQNSGVPVRWASTKQIGQIPVFQVHYIEAIEPKAIVVCRNEQDQMGSLSFDWSEVKQRVEGRLPIFEQVVDLGYRDKLERKQKTQDYAQFCDLHLPGRGCILRFHDGSYDFDRSIPVVSSGNIHELDLSIVRTNWNSLLGLFNQHMHPNSVWSDFTPFGETTADFAAPLNRLKPKTHLLRQVDSYWDSAFHLYSSLIFLHS
jgi:tetratricopeptide (TPR) repeat protein